MGKRGEPLSGIYHTLGNMFYVSYETTIQCYPLIDKKPKCQEVKGLVKGLQLASKWQAGFKPKYV